VALLLGVFQHRVGEHSIKSPYAIFRIHQPWQLYSFMEQAINRCKFNL